MSNNIKIISATLCLMMILSVLSGCTNSSDSKKKAETVFETVKATADEATIQPTNPQTVQLALEEKDFPTINLGLMYSEGKKVEQNIVKAKEYFELAVNQGYSKALLSLLCGGIPTSKTVSRQRHRHSLDQAVQ